MALTTGANLGLLDNGTQGEQHYAEMMKFFRGVDLLVMPRAISATITTPPGSPSDGDTYIVPSGASGAWSGQTGKIARWSARLGTPAWEFFTPKKGWETWVDGSGLNGQRWRYSGTAWANVFTLPTYADQAAAGTAGLLAGDLFAKADGTVMVKT